MKFSIGVAGQTRKPVQRRHLGLPARAGGNLHRQGSGTVKHCDLMPNADATRPKLRVSLSFVRNRKRGPSKPFEWNQQSGCSTACIRSKALLISSRGHGVGVWKGVERGSRLSRSAPHKPGSSLRAAHSAEGAEGAPHPGPVTSWNGRVAIFSWAWLRPQPILIRGFTPAFGQHSRAAPHFTSTLADALQKRIIKTPPSVSSAITSWIGRCDCSGIKGQSLAPGWRAETANFSGLVSNPDDPGWPRPSPPRLITARPIREGPNHGHRFGGLLSTWRC